MQKALLFLLTVMFSIISMVTGTNADIITDSAGASITYTITGAHITSSSDTVDANGGITRNISGTLNASGAFGISGLLKTTTVPATLSALALIFTTDYFEDSNFETTPLGTYSTANFNVSVNIPPTQYEGSLLITMDNIVIAATFNANPSNEIYSHPELQGGPWDQPFTVFVDNHGPGTCPAQGQGLPKYSVNTSTLNLVVQDTDYKSSGLGPEFATTRTWNSNPYAFFTFGNWIFSYDMLIVSDCSGASVIKGSGQLIHYTASGLCSGATSVSATPPTGDFNKLTLMPGNYWLWQEKNTKYTYRFESPDGSSGNGAIYILASITDSNGNVLSLTRNANQNITRITDAAGRVTAFGYDPNGLCTSMTTPDGKVATYSYDSNGNLTTTVDLLGTAITYGYNSNNYMTSMTVGDKVATFTYGTTGGWTHISSVTNANSMTRNYTATSPSQTTVTDARSGQSTYANQAGLTSGTADPLNYFTFRSYTNGLPTAITDENWNKTSIVYDSNGNIITITDPLQNITTYTYDAHDNVHTITDALGKVWTFDHDNNSNLTKTTSPLNIITQYQYNTKGQMTTKTDGNGKVTTYTYDSYGNVASIKDPLGYITVFGYDLIGNKTAITDANGNTTYINYDNNRRPVQVINPDGTYKVYGYDACSLGTGTDENGHQTILTRDKMLNITGTTDPLNNVTTNTYDANNNLATVTNALLKTTTNTYDADDRLTEIVDPASYTINVGYDGNGNMLSFKDKLQKTTSFVYDFNNHLTSTTDPLGKVVVNGRDALGRISSVTNARGAIVGFKYDNDGRLITKTYNGTTAASFGYDSAGNMTTVTDSTGTTTYSHNDRNGITDILYPDGKAASFTYDAYGNISKAVYAGLTVNYTYDIRNRVSDITWDGSSISLNYDDAGNLVNETRNNGTTTDYFYDGNNRVNSINHKNGVTVIAQMNYTRNALGNVSNESDILPIAPAAETPGIVSGQYNDANQVATMGSDNYTYDADGNLTGISGTRIFSGSYDLQNRLTGFTMNGVTSAYTYDGLGNRMKSVSGSTTKNYHYDHMGRLLFETNASGNVTTAYVYAGGMVEAMKENNTSYFYHRDKTGNTISLTNSTGTVVQSYAYEPYGDKINASGSLYNPFTFVGAFGVMNEGNGIYFMKNRYYDSVNERFLQKDPLSLAGGDVNLYAYVHNNPVNFVDPLGKAGENEHLLNPDSVIPPPPYEGLSGYGDENYLGLQGPVGTADNYKVLGLLVAVPLVIEISEIALTQALLHPEISIPAVEIVNGVAPSGLPTTLWGGAGNFASWLYIENERIKKKPCP